MKKLICLCLSFLMAFSVLCTSAFAAEVIRYGDVSGDGIIDVYDLLLLRKRVARIIGNSDINKTNSDVNADGSINSLDLSYLRNHLTKKKVIEASSVYPVSSLLQCMNLYGRAEISQDGSSILLSQTASGFEFTANCAGNIEIIMQTAKKGKLNITVDKDYENSYEVNVDDTTKKCVVQTDLTYGEHTFLIQKATEHGQNPLFEITGVSVGGELADTKPVQSEKRIEFYGDSITAGYGNLTTNATTNAGGWEYQNGCKTYATFTAQTLGADYAIAAASGHGVLGGFNTYTQTPDKYWDYTLVADKTPWSRTNYDADLIVINFGANDNSREGANLDKEAFLAKASILVETMKAENPDVEILWITGMNAISESMPIISALKSLDEKFDYVNFLHANPRQNGGDWHPSVEDHKYHATQVVNKIKALYPDMF